MLEDQLVVGDVLFHPVEKETRHLFLTPYRQGPPPPGNLDISGFTQQMLGITDTTHGTVQRFATVTAGDEDGAAELQTGRFQTIHGEVPDAQDMTLQGDIGDSESFGCSGV
jgi:hypothetical protein